MSRRPAALLLLPLALGVAAAVQPPATSTARYKVEMLATSAVDLSSMGQGEQRNEFAMTAFVSVTLTDSADGQVMHAVLDSSSVTPLPPGAPPGALEGQPGAAYHGFVRADGKTEGFQVMGDSTAPKGGALVTQVLRDFFPTVKAGFQAGDTWRDSTEVRENQAGGSSVVVRITEYTAGEAASWAGREGQQLNATTKFTVSSQNDTPGGPTSVEGAGTGTAAWYLTGQGEFLGGTSETSADLTAMTAYGDFPVKQTTKTTITALP